MAVSTVSNTSQILALLAKRFGLANITIDKPVGHSLIVLRVYYRSGGSAAMQLPPDSDEQTFLNAVQQLAQPAPNELDLRQNAIEGVDDVISLIQQAKNQRRHTDVIILTPEQLTTLQSDPMLPAQNKSGLHQIYGHRLRVES